MDTEFLNTLIKVVTLGVSGVCIVGALWAGWLLMNLPADATIERQKAIKSYLLIGVVIALISSAAGLMNTQASAQEEIAELEDSHQEFTDGYRFGANARGQDDR